MKRVISFASVLTALLLGLGATLGLTNTAQANPNPSTTPSAAPTIGATGLYMFAQDGGNVSLRQVNTTDGDVSLAYPQTSIMTTLKGAAQNPLTGVVWVIRQDCRLFTVNMTTGALSSATPSVLQPTLTCNGIAFDATGQMFAVVNDPGSTPDGSEWVVVDQSTGFFTTYLSPLWSVISALSYNPVTGVIQALENRSNPVALEWYSIDTVTHSQSHLLSAGPMRGTLAITPTGQVYSADSGLLETGSSMADVNSLTFVGYTNNVWALSGTLFWYVSPSVTPSPTSTSTSSAVPVLANTGSDDIGSIALALALCAGGFVLLALIPLVRRQ